MVLTTEEENTLQATIDKIKTECRRSGDGCAERVETFIRQRLADYSDKLGFSQVEILTALENHRDYYAPNYYQELKLPDLARVRIFANEAELISTFPAHQFVCPVCEAISTNPYECNSGKEVEGRACDWKAYGLFHTFGKGLRFTIREKFLARPVIDEIFMPVELMGATA